MKRLVLLLVLVALVLAIALPAMAVSANATKVHYSSGDYQLMAYYMNAGKSGVVQDWVYYINGESPPLHQIFQPATKWAAPDCQEYLYDEYGNPYPNPNFIRKISNYTFDIARFNDTYTDDEGSIGDFLTSGATYQVCVYSWEGVPGA